jgi:hypothetical protein
VMKLVKMCQNMIFLIRFCTKSTFLTVTVTASCLTRVWWPMRRRGWAGGDAPPPPPGGGRDPTCSWDAGAAPADTNGENTFGIFAE